MADADRALLPLDQYDYVLASYSGGKDSLALILHLLEIGVDRDRLELWHQAVDGGPNDARLFDWPCTESYVRATGKALDIPVRFQWRDGGFLREMLREDDTTAGVFFEDGQGELQYLPPAGRKRGTRRLFPQVSADLKVRWCSAALKIDVAKRAINNDPRFAGARILFVTGERAQESTARAKYAAVVPHGSDTQRRRVDQWRAVLEWSEEQVWEIIRRHRLRPHPAYYLGWGRVSCMTCIFGNGDQWASVQQIAPQHFAAIAAYEEEFGKTIQRTRSVVQQAAAGQPYAELDQAEIVALALSTVYPTDYLRLAAEEIWQQPAGAFRRCGGPT